MTVPVDPIEYFGVMRSSVIPEGYFLAQASILQYYTEQSNEFLQMNMLDSINIYKGVYNRVNSEFEKSDVWVREDRVIELSESQTFIDFQILEPGT